MSLASFLDRLMAERPIPRRKKRFRPPRFFVEALEDRALLTTYTVNSTDPGLGGAGVNTLVEAIAQANADTTDSNPFILNFDIPTSDPGYNATTGVWTIALIGSGLPIITHPVVIDATSQPGYKGQPLIDIDGTHSTLGFVQGLDFTVGGNTVKGLDITNFENFGIVLDGTNDPNHNTGPGLNNIIQANYIGTDGVNAEPNLSGGIDLVNSSYNLIGGLNTVAPPPLLSQLVQGNLISGNGLTGIFLENQGDTHNYIEGNYIGTDASGMKALDATNLPAPVKVTDGIFLGPSLANPSDGFASNNIIGDFDPNEKQYDPNGRNVIAGNLRNGVYILGGTGNEVSGNFIGIGSDGATAVPNGEDGVRLEDASSNTIGGGDGNVISGNRYNGVEIVADSASEDGLPVPVLRQVAENNVVQGNNIGTNEAGTAAVPNGGQGFGDGVLLDNAGTAVVASNTIGGNLTIATRNIISGNLGSGVALIGTAIQSNFVQGNYIGTDETGEKPLGNHQSGVWVTGVVGQTGAPSGNTIGSLLPSDVGGNVISANLGNGVLINNGASATHVNNNLIGVDATAHLTDPDGQPGNGDELGNHLNGVLIEQAAGNFVGDPLAGGNTISGNFQSGVLIAGANAQNNTLVRNLIGVGSAAFGYPKLPNGQGGVCVTGALGDGNPSFNTIGGLNNSGAPYLGNTISGNHLDGVELDGGATLTKILGNFIGTDPSSATSLGNDGNGIDILDSFLNTVGGTGTATRNIIVNNGVDGVLIEGAAAKGNVVSGDYIGIAADGVTAAGNVAQGVVIQNGATTNFVGTTGQNGGDVISGNKGNGIDLSSAGAGNTIQNNFIGLNATGTGSLPNTTQGNGILVDNTPGTVIGAASFSQGGNVISGNAASGVFVGGKGSVGTQIEGNYIGTDQLAATAVSNQLAGIILAAVSAVPAAVGPSTNANISANTIGGNLQGGILLGVGTNGNTITSNFIGTNAQGANLGNTGYGIRIDGSPNNFIGFGTPIASLSNTIAYTTVDPKQSPDSTVGSGHGIDITGSKATNNYVWANTISGNAGSGVQIDAGDNGQNGGPTFNTIGGVGGLGNTIIGNFIGVQLDGQGTSNNVVLGNLIGIDKKNSPTANDTGVQIADGASSNVVGGASAGAANIISDSTNSGIFIEGSHNTIEGNEIGTNLNGAYQAGFGNKHYGIVINSGHDNTIGGATSAPGAAPGNTIFDNGAGVLLEGGTRDNNLLGNAIASSVRFIDPNDPDKGTVNGDGVDVYSASHNVIGGVNNADANKIVNNADAGVHVEAGSAGISILHNAIFANDGLGILLDPAAGDNQGGNNSQPAPVLRAATTGLSHRVAGWLQGTPNASYTVEFFTGQYNTFTGGGENDDAEHLLIPLPPTLPEPGVNVTATGVTLTTNGSGVCLFDLPLPSTIAVNTIIRATATDSSGNTSRFSKELFVSTDSNGDGIPDQEEKGSPNGKSQSPNVASFQDALDSTQYITLQAPAGIALQNVWSVTNPSPNDAPQKYMFGLGFVDFTLAGVSPGQHVAVTMTLPVELGAENKYFRYGPTPDNTSPHWYEWKYDPATDTGAEINGKTVILHFVNGGRGDDDINANNTFIQDAGGPGFPGPYTVINTADSGPGSLRQAILNADADSATVSFDIPGAGPWSIEPLSPLPALTNYVTIDGTTQPGYTGKPLVEINGSQASPAAEGLTVASGSDTIQGLVINRFSGDGIHVLGGASATIEGNYIGTDTTGTVAEGNGRLGVELENDTTAYSASTINGGNVISGNLAGGISIHGAGANFNRVTSNFIGTQADGTSPLGNGGPGILLDGGASFNDVGQQTSPNGNTIAFNAGAGVDVLQGSYNLIEANSVYGNKKLGIDLGGDGVTPNHTGTSNGPNELQNFPVLASAASSGGRTFISGTLTSLPNLSFTIDFYDSAATDPSGYGQGQIFLGSIIVLTDANGQASFDVNLPGSVAAGSYITATSSLNDQETSEFSAALQVPAASAPLVFIVNTTDDVNDAVPVPTHFSLREAIVAANNHPGQDTIDFELPKGNYVIRPTSALPDITDPVIIDGTTQPGFRGLPLVELDGSQAGTADGLRITSGGSIVRGLIIHSFQQAGIELAGGGGSTIEGNFVGSDATGTSAMPDPYADVYVNASNDNLIGGTTTAACNVLAFVHVTGYNQNTGHVDPNAGGNRIEGNYIGTDLTGTALLSGVTARGVIIDTSSGNTIGGAEVGAGNLIAGGVSIFDGNSNVVQGNLIGTNDKGTVALAGGAGVDIDGEAFSAAYNQIGGSTPAARNIIAGTVHISGQYGFDNKVEGNYIGTDVTGAVALGNAVGVDITGAYNTIGGADAGAGNLISGNAGPGILLEFSAHNNTITGNRIGTDVTGTKALANIGYGVVSDGSDNTIGGTAPGAGNLISGNALGGIALAGAGGDVVQGNYVGTDVTGTIALGNGLSNGSGGSGIAVEERYAVVGGFYAGAGNVISGNAGSGVAVNAPVGGYVANRVSIVGNYIGTDASGTAPLGNGLDGVTSRANTYGTIRGNVIAANAGDGIRIFDDPGDVQDGNTSIGTVIRGNKIGTDVTGTKHFSNSGEGISIITSPHLASDETLGGTNPGDGNTIAFNGGPGVDVPFGTGNTIEGNSIYDNNGLGIISDINSALSTCAEPRGLALPQTAPMLSSAVFYPQGTVVTGSLTGTPFTQYNVDFFANLSVNPSGFGDGQTYLETITLFVDNTGTVTFQIPLDTAVPVGQWITATATPADQSGDTSIFSQPVQVAAAAAETLQFSSPVYTATESGPEAVVTVTRSVSTAGAVTVDYATTGGTAIAGTDYTAVSGTLTFADGVASQTITVPLEDDGQDDGQDDGNETFDIALSNANGASLGTVSQAAVTLADRNPAGQIEFASATATIDKALGPYTLQVTRSGGSQGTATVEYRVTGGTAVPYWSNSSVAPVVDYSDFYGTLTFADGQTTAQISFIGAVAPGVQLGNLPYRGPQTIVVTLGNPTGGATLGQITTSTLTIDDPEDQHGAFGISTNFTSATVPENSGSEQITVFRAGQLTTLETVAYTTVDGTAKAGTNYVATSGVLTFQPGQASAYINVPIIGDHIVANPGDFQVVLSKPTGGTFIFTGDGSVDVTILDSDVPAPQSFRVDNQLFNEDSSVAQVTVSRLGGASGTVQVNYVTSDGTATAGLAYQTESGTLTFNAGQTSQTFSVPILRHNFVGDETFFVTLSNPTGGATLDPKNPATMTLAGTSGQVQVASATYPVAENNAELTVTIPLDVTGAAHGTTTVDYATHDGTAKAGVDYTAVSGTLRFTGAVGTMTIPIKNELVDDGDETFFLTLSNPTGGITLGSQNTTAITILETNLPQQQPSTTTLTSDAPSGSTYGQTVTFTAAVTAGNGAPGGSVDFVDTTTGQDLGTVQLAVVNGVDEASVSVSSLAVGSHTIVASYTSDNNNVAGSHDSLVQAVASATLTVTADNKTMLYGATVPTLTDTITGFVNGDTASVVSGLATLSTAATTASGVGTYPITIGPGTLSAANYTFALVNGVLTVYQDTTTTTVGATQSGLNITFTATVTANAPGSGTPTGSVDFFDTTTHTDLGSVVLSAASASLTTTLPHTTQSIAVSYQGDANFIASSATTSVSPLASVYVLNPSVSGALTASGNAKIEVPGAVVDDSNSATAITANGNVQIAASEIDVVGGVRTTGHASFSPAPVTGHAVVPDPYRNLAAPSGGTSLGDISLAGNSSLTIHPGVYTKINVSGNAKLTMTSGVYVIAGGGLSVSGNANVSGSQVMIYNAGGNYLGGSGFGAISLSGNGQIALSAPTPGPYAGVLLFQARDNQQALSLIGNAVNGLSGTIYAASAPASLSGNATLNLPVVVNTLTLSGNAVLGDPPADPPDDPPADPPIATEALSGSGLAVSGYELSPLNDVAIATFTSSDASETADALNATIDWGDGSTSTGAVTLSNDQFTVSGSHTYGDEGSYSIVVTVSDGQVTTTIASPANIAEELLAEGMPGTADQRFITEIYRDVLGRQAEPQGRDYWVSHLERGDSRAKVVQDILAAVTEEYHRDLIQAEFARYLRRSPDPAAMQFFTGLLDDGGDAAMLDAILVSSPEYFQEHGGTLDQFVDALFRDALGRPVDPPALAAIEARAAEGATRAQIADVVFSSEEYRRDLVAGWYRQYLDRAPDAAGLASYTSQLDAGLPAEHVVAAMLSSGEFAGKV